MEPWFVKHKTRLEKECRALEAAGFAYEIDEDLKATGRIKIRVEVPHNGTIFNTEATFPFFYPYTPFTLVCHDAPNGRHKDPYHGSICFLHDLGSSWRTKDTLAGILNNQFKSVIDAHLNSTNDPLVEALDAAPQSGQIDYVHEQVILVPNFQIPDKYQYGYAQLACERGVILKKYVRGFIQKISTKNRKEILFEVGEDIPGLFELSKNSSAVPVRWVRLEVPPAKLGENILDEAIQKWPSLREPYLKKDVDIVALIFQEEVKSGVEEENWVFVVRRKNPKNPRYCLIENVRADIIDPRTVTFRSPKTASLSGKKVTIIGCGALGSFIAMQMGRLGLKEMVLVDGDHVEFGNLPRWVAGANASGFHKVVYLKSALTMANPFMKVVPYPINIGIPIVNDPIELEIKFVEDVLDTDLIIDATAEYTASHLITDLAKENGVPCVHVTGTPGSYGGVISKFLPDKDAFCWGCLQEYLSDETIKRPPEEIGKTVQVRGCFHPTFTGTGFDMDYLALGTVRMAVATLCMDNNDGYPNLDWNASVIGTWDSDINMPIIPEWNSKKYDRHPKCMKHE